MQERYHKLVVAHGNRALWRLQVKQPDDEWMEVFRGEEVMYVWGKAEPLPVTMFGSEEDGRVWALAG